MHRRAWQIAVVYIYLSKPLFSSVLMPLEQEINEAIFLKGIVCRVFNGIEKPYGRTRDRWEAKAYLVVEYPQRKGECQK
jgi:hypothetical protein